MVPFLGVGKSPPTLNVLQPGVPLPSSFCPATSYCFFLLPYPPPCLVCLCPSWVKYLCTYQAPGPEAGRSTRVTLAVVDTFVWQSLASVAIPGFTINRLCAASLYLLGTMTRWPLTFRKWTTTTLGLLAIPFIVHPIDRSVDFLLDSSLRKLYPSVGKPSSS